MSGLGSVLQAPIQALTTHPKERTNGCFNTYHD